MSEYKQYMEEKEKIDALLEQGYQIVEVKENLSGAFVQFQLTEYAANENEDTKQLHILTPDARKYFSNIIIKQQRGAQ